MKKILIGIGLTLGFIPTLQALPTLYPTKLNQLSAVENPTNSNLIADSIDQNMFHVMPPNTARSKVNGLQLVTTHVKFCSEMSDLQQYSSEMAATIASLGSKEEQERNKIEKLYDQLLVLEDQLAQYAQLSVVSELRDLDDLITDLDLRIEELIEKMETCQQDCSALNTEYDDTRQRRKEFHRDRRELARNHRDEARLYEQAQQRILAMTKRIERQTQSWEALKTSLSNMRKNFVELYKDLGELPGASAKISFTSQWDQNVQNLREANPGLKFQKIETRDALLSSNIINLKNIPSHHAILGYDIGGIVNEFGQVEMNSYPQVIQGNIQLSLIGACPLLYPESFEIADLPGVEDLEFGLVVQYEYPTLFATKARIDYNMYKMYQKIQEYSSRGGGFFRSRRVSHSVTERNEFRDSFNVTWTDHLGMDDQKKAELEQEMRTRIFERLAKIGLPSLINAGDLQLPKVPASGALVLSEGIKKACPSKNICIGASLAVDFLEAMFGRSSSTASYTNIQDIKLSETWSNTQIHWRPWISSYTNLEE